ncbi:MAG: GNAT family N-acetyltransferase [Pseudomonadota bacterium]
MTTEFRIRPMSLADMETAVEWAAKEGWNPGLYDADAFRAVDPEGFLMGWIGDVPVSAISVVRHTPDFGFLGFNLCHPEHRGKGFGWQTWQAGMAHLGARTVGLDGVPAQQANYERSGFALAHNTRRHAGTIEGQADADCVPAATDDIAELLEFDRKVSGVARSAYLTAWFDQSDTRHTMVCRSSGRLAGFGTIRACRQGHKIGPVFATDTETARRLIRALVAEAKAREIMIDVPDPNKAGVSLAEQFGLNPVFSCARMYRGDAPLRALGSIFGETSFELG